MKDFTDDLKDLRRRLEEAKGYLKIDAGRIRLVELETEVGRPDLWDDPERAKAVNAEYAAVRDDIATYDALAQQVDDAEVLHDLARELGDESQEPDIAAAVRGLEAAFDELELRSLFTGDHDHSDAIVTIAAKDGGTDAQDFAEILLRMYLRWAERHGFTAVVDDVTEGTEAGILSATLRISGRYAYGWMNSERGVHRLVRISPFDNNARRQTSFVAVTVVPVLEDLAEIQIDDKDLRVDTYRSSGAGGQHINKTSSAVRITHLPSGIVVSCQNERSQIQNRARAMESLAAILAARAEEERRAHLDQLAGDRAKVGWGSQIRSYVLQPYQLVKDLRTNHESGNPLGVFDGDLDEFMEAYLRWRRREEVGV